jgi:DNA-directed RNA polymerase subunit RPC12/RpoP
MIETICQKCGNKKSFSEDKFGKKFKCPECGNAVLIEEATPKDSAINLTSQPTLLSKNKLPQPLPEVSSHFPWKHVIVAVFLIIIAGGILFYLFWLKPYLEDKNAKRYYTYIDNLVMRSSQIAGVDYNFIQKLSYGAELIVYTVNPENTEWAFVKANEQKGYVSTQFILNKRDFNELNGIFGDVESKETISTAKCRKALLLYFQDTINRNITGKIDPQIQREIYGSIKNREIWQVFSRGKDINPNTVAFPRITDPNSKFTDFACIIKNIVTSKRKLLLFTFSETGVPRLYYEGEAPDEGYIESIKKPFRSGETLPLIKYTQIY